jgi:hypothetical protein
MVYDLNKSKTWDGASAVDARPAGALNVRRNARLSDFDELEEDEDLQLLQT